MAIGRLRRNRLGRPGWMIGVSILPINPSYQAKCISSQCTWHYYSESYAKAWTELINHEVTCSCAQHTKAIYQSAYRRKLENLGLYPVQ